MRRIRLCWKQLNVLGLPTILFFFNQQGQSSPEQRKNWFMDAAAFSAHLRNRQPCKQHFKRDKPLGIAEEITVQREDVLDKACNYFEIQGIASTTPRW